MTTIIPNIDVIFQSMPAAFAVLNREFEFIEANQRHCDVVFTPREKLIGGFVFDLFPETPEREALVRDGFTRALNGEAYSMPEVGYAIPAPDGTMTEIYWTVHCVPIEPGVCFGIHSEEVTAVVKAKELSDAIAAELQHRVGNILTVIGATARQTARSYLQIDDFMTAFQGRLESIQITNAMLTGGNWDGLTFAQLVNRQLEPFKGLIGGQIAIGGEDFRIDSTEAQTLSMALHELLTNAQKYGALATADGKLTITYEPIGKGGYQINWSEAGLRDVKKPVRKGFGNTILNSLVPSQLGAEVRQHFSETRHDFRILLGRDN